MSEGGGGLNITPRQRPEISPRNRIQVSVGPAGTCGRSPEPPRERAARGPRASPRPGPGPRSGVSERQAALPLPRLLLLLLPRRCARFQPQAQPGRLSPVRPGQAQAAGWDSHPVFYLGTFQETPVTWPSALYRLSGPLERAFLLLLSQRIAGIVLWQRAPQMSARRGRLCMPRREG